MRARDSRRILWVVLLLLLILILAGGATAYSVLAANRITGQQTIVMAPETMPPGGQTMVRAIVQDFNTGAPIPKAAVAMRLVPVSGGPSLTLFEGRTDAKGAVEARLTVPSGVEQEQKLVIEARSDRGSDKLERAVEVRRDYKLLLTTDKPLYQPGQTIHIRSLALTVGDLTPAMEKGVEFTIEDPKGNKIHRNTVNTSSWGICSLDFALAPEVNTGLYKITARLGETESEKTVTVKPYVLPKFKIAVQTDKDFYRPGETVNGSLQASYFFGKPVSEGKVEMRGYLYEIERREVTHLTGKTDAEGNFEFQFDLPRYFVGGTLEPGKATFGLEVTVIDQADHAEQTASTLPISEEPILIEAVPESGELKPGVENIVYIVTTYPDGAPVEAALTVHVGSRASSLKTGRYGLAEFSFVPAEGGPASLTIEARDAQGNQATHMAELPWKRADEYILLRPERAAYRVGETMHIEALTSAQRGTVYLDIVREGQTLSMRALDIKDGRVIADVDLDETLFGTLQLHAYKVLQNASIVADTRLVVVDRARDIDLHISADKESYRPGEVAKLAFQTKIGEQPIPAALGLSIVDESVFALQEQEAGFAKLYFLLQAEILEPKYQLKWFRPYGYIPESGASTEIRNAQDQTTKAALAQVPALVPKALGQTREQKYQAIASERRTVYKRTNNGLAWAVVALSALGFLVGLVGLARRKILRRSLGYGLLVFLAMIGIGALIIAPFAFSDSWRAREMFLPLLLLGLALAALISLIIFAVQAWRRKDEALQAIYLLLVGCLVLLPLVGFTAARAQEYKWEEQLFGPILALALALLGIYLRGVGYGVEGQKGPALAGVLAGGLFIMTMSVLGAGLLVFQGGARAGMSEAVQMAMPARRLGRDVVVMEKLMVEKEVMPMPIAAPMAPSAAEMKAGAQEPPRLRQFFPETMYWNPQVLTDESGKAEIEIPMADSITTWRLSALASSQRGELGSATAGLRVFQDFFIDLDLPLYLTQNDEVSLPVAVFNYLPHEQSVRLEVKEEPWFKLLDEREKTMTIASNDIEVVYFRIRALQFGQNSFQVTAWGEKMGDAIVKEVKVMPDGKEFRLVSSDNLRESVAKTVLIPEAAIPGTAKVWVKVYPGIVSQIIEGLSGLLRMPFG